LGTTGAGAVATDQFQDFLTWLTNHNFQDLRSLILQYTERKLKNLLRQDSALISEKLDFACSALSSISDRIDALAPLSRALHAATRQSAVMFVVRS
jgi:hypothetical protein